MPILPSEMPTKKAFWDLTNMTSGFATMCSRGRRKFLKVSKTLSKHRGMSWKKFYDHTTLQKKFYRDLVSSGQNFENGSHCIKLKNSKNSVL